ncbi:MAG: transglutaminase domain-containing protein [Phycisphaerae bacterium]|jgi:hypothetical protein
MLSKRIVERNLRWGWPILAAAALVLPAGCVSTQPADVRANLSKAGRHRGELERVLQHYQESGDTQKLLAAQFLIANMDGHGFAEMAMYDENKKEIPYDALAYPDVHAAQDAYDVLQKQHGKLHTDRKHVHPDLETMPADLLIENIDLAFQAWQERPWARQIPFEQFCELVLPYRSGKEPLNSTRPACLARYADLPSRMKAPSDPREAAALILRDVDNWIRFNEQFYFHPTEQSFEEMCQRQQGRCGDISNMQMYALRANAVPAARDYSPLWANRDNNHAWVVVVDEHGVGRAPLTAVPAKVYRTTFVKQRESLAARVGPEEPLPYWLRRWNFVDVTPQYVETTDVTVHLTQPAPAGTRYAYICVFNDGEWGPVHWGEIHDGLVTFTQMGRNAVYLPAYYIDEKVVPAAPPFIVAKTGTVRVLAGAGDELATLQLNATAPDGLYSPGEAAKPLTRIEPGRQYELFVWDNGWVSAGEQQAEGTTLTFNEVPADRLYWLLPRDSRKLERIFIFDDGQQVWW